MNNYTLMFIEDRWAFYSEMIYANPKAEQQKMNYWIERMQYWYRRHEERVPITQIINQLTPKTEP